MNNEQINEAIHEKVMGEGCYHSYQLDDTGNDHDDGYYGIWVCSLCADTVKICAGNGLIQHKPDYCTDLNAVARAEAKVIDANGYPLYLSCLDDATCRYRQSVATARQRAEACLRATGNWREDE